MRAPGAILLDALGTLLALEPPAPLLRAQLAERFAVQISDAEATRAMLAEIGYYRAHTEEGRDDASVARLRRRCAKALRDALPPRDGAPRLDLDELTEALLASLRFTAFDDARRALSAARERGLRLVVVSNWDASLHQVLAQLELTPFLDGVVTSAQAGARKPSPAIFERALALAAAPAADATHVGDSVEEDVVGAISAGVQPILVRRDGRPGPSGIRTIASLDELELGEA